LDNEADALPAFLAGDDDEVSAEDAEDLQMIAAE
jgi:hypothetical protein